MLLSELAFSNNITDSSDDKNEISEDKFLSELITNMIYYERKDYITLISKWKTLGRWD